MSETRSKKTRSRVTAWWYGNCGRNQLLPGSIGLSSQNASITYDWHVSGATTECFWLCPSQATDRHKDGQRHTYGRTDVNEDTQTDAHQGRNRDKRQKSTDENQETVRETRTVVRHGVHCDACCCGWLWGDRVVLLCCWCCVLVSLLLVPFEWWLPPFSSLDVAVCPLLPWSGGDLSPQVAKTPGCPRQHDEAQTPRVPKRPVASTGKDGARLVCPIQIFITT